MVNESEVLFRPYAPPANMQAFMHRLRRMNMPPRITRDILKVAGISENIIPRVFATLRFLDLVTDKDEPTDTLRGLAGSTEDEYRQLLERTIRRAYADDFESIDPSKDPQERIMNAFQRYTPRSQHGRQVMLFLGLCREAGVQTVDVPRRRGMRGKSLNQKSTGMALPQRPVQNPDGTGAQLAHRPNGQRIANNPPTQFLGITLEDAAHMPEEDFWEVWSAVGTVFLRRAQRTYLVPQSDTAPQTEDEGFS
ncbi:MAG: DUF5343 domain-containing protein [Chloroflexota bacterium]